MGKIVVMTTKFTQEGSNMSVYEVGQKIKNAFGLIESYDMTPGGHRHQTHVDPRADEGS